MPTSPRISRRRFVLAGGACVAAACHRSPVGEPLATDALAAPLPGLALAVGSAGAVLRASGHGYASVALQVPATPRTLFHIGSLGKSVTAYAIFVLAQAGELDLDASISAYLDDLPLEWRAPSVRHLLTHTAGLRDYDEAGFEWDRPLSRERFFALAGSPFAAPGECWYYSGAGYVLLGWLIEAVSGLTYARFVHGLFARIGLRDARIDAAGDVVERRAEPHVRTAAGWRHAVRMETEISQSADGGVLFSAADFGRWMLELREPTLLSAGGAAEMFEPVWLRSGRRHPYGCGWFVESTQGRPFYWHDGGVPGFSAVATWSPAADAFAFAATNAEVEPRWLLSLAARLQETEAPGSTPLSTAPRDDTAPHFTAVALALLGRDSADQIDAELLAPELQPLQRERSLTAKIAPRFAEIETLTVLEEWRFGDCLARRYRVEAPNAPAWPVAMAHTPDERIAWVLW